MMYKKIVSLALFSFLFHWSLLAQQATLKGQVKDTENNAIVGANVILKNYKGIGVATNVFGYFELKVPAQKTIEVEVSAVNYATQKHSFTLAKGEKKEWAIQLKETGYKVPNAVVTGEKTRYREAEQMVELEVKDAVLPSTTGDIASFLEGQAFIHKNNELSTAYSVRGGNFDENLVYVNGFEIYRPFLIRSGQQEGLSFVNPDMVRNIAFSAGGFQAKYGDKMASVLDVEYKRPQKFGGSVMASLLGASAQVEGTDKKKRFTYSVGARYKTSKLLLGALEAKGQYQPTFVDVQGFFTYKISPKIRLEYIGNYALNQFDFTPIDRTTDFGLANFQQRFTMYYENGSQENDRYHSLMNGLALVYKLNENIDLKFLASAYNMTEYESFDLLGEYFLGEVETDPAKENVGQVKNITGTGAFHDWARNSLFTDVYNVAHRGNWRKNNHRLDWGLNYKHEIIQDKISEWQRIDSAGYNLPHTGSGVVLYNVLKPEKLYLESDRLSGYLQHTWAVDKAERLNINYGVRFQYWTINQKFFATPRAQISYKPKTKNGHLSLRASGGLYYQMPFYREMRNLKGEVNRNLLPQKSAHAILGLDYSFKAWDRKFRFITEAYYKYMWDNVPYKYENILIRYYGTNNSKGYTAGIDFRLNGQLADGVESWVSLSLMSAEEDILDDYYTTYEVRKTKTEENGVILSQTLDTVKQENVYPGYIPKPTDQRVRFALYFQDYIPKFPYIKVHLNLVLATGLPFGAPKTERYKDVYRTTAYRRFDIGFSASLYNRKIRLEKGRKIPKSLKHLKSVWFSFEVFNLFDIKNVSSYTWAQAYDRRTQTLGQYAIPNNLTDRRFNAKLRIEF